MKSNRLIALALILLPILSASAAPNLSAFDQRSFLFSWPGQDARESMIDPHEAIVTDRPSFTDSSRTVGKGVTQFELGYIYSYSDSSNSDPRFSATHSYPDLSLRQGVFANWLELRVAGTITSYTSSGDSETGIMDPQLGFRLGLFAQHGFLPELSITPRTSLPIGSPSVRSDKALPAIGASYSWSITDSLSLSGATNFSTLERHSDGDSYRSWGQTAMISVKSTAQTSLWIEAYAALPQHSSGELDTYYGDAGALYLISDNTQLDLRMGSKLQDRFGQDIFAAVGVSVRWGRS